MFNCYTAVRDEAGMLYTSIAFYSVFTNNVKLLYFWIYISVNVTLNKFTYNDFCCYIPQYVLLLIKTIEMNYFGLIHFIIHALLHLQKSSIGIKKYNYY